jgi:hypothetical protein
VTDWQVVWLAVMAISLVVMAVIQVGLIVAVLLLVRQVNGAVQEVRREIRPVIEKLNRIADEAGRATSLASTQLERIDEFLATTFAGIEETVSIVRDLASGPVRQGAAFVAAFRAIAGALRRRAASDAPAGRDEDDTWFVG